VHQSPANTQNHRVRGILTRLFAFLFIVAMLQPLAGSPAAAKQSAGLPENVLQASVRITIMVEVTPDDEDEDPFFCEIDTNTPLEIGNGSGTIITADGHILTNHHVMDAGEMLPEIETFCERQAPRRRASVEYTHIVWLPDERGTPTDAYRVELIEDSSLAEDMALIQISEHLDGARVDTDENPFPFVEFGDSDDLREPEKITVIGYPANAGPQRRVSEGIFSGWGDNGYGVEWIYTDATTSGGNSGGTALNDQGLFIGIPSAATSDDCRPDDTNFDGVIDENDGCVGLGGNYGLLVPGNTAREFAEEAAGIELPIVDSGTPVEDDPTQTPEETPANTDGPPFGDVSFTAYNLEGEPIDELQNVNLLEACFENNWVEDGQDLTATWYLDGEAYYTDEYVWDEAWNPQACATLYVEEDEAVPFLDPGAYHIELTVEGQTVTSDEVEVTLSSFVDSVSFRARDADRETIEPDAGNVIAGEIETLYADIEFTGMAEGSIWEIEWYRDGELVVTSDPEAWGDEPDGSETARLRNPDREPLEPGEYEVVILVDGEEAHRAPVTIED
jgi:S1-C subfamily serine protease